MFQSQLNISNSSWDRWLPLSLSTTLTRPSHPSLCPCLCLQVQLCPATPLPLSSNCGAEMDFTVCLKLLFSRVDGWVQCLSVCRCWCCHFSLSISGAGGLSHVSAALCSLPLKAFMLRSQRFEPARLITCVTVLQHIGSHPSTVHVTYCRCPLRLTLQLIATQTLSHRIRLKVWGLNPAIGNLVQVILQHTHTIYQKNNFQACSWLHKSMQVYIILQSACRCVLIAHHLSHSFVNQNRSDTWKMSVYTPQYPGWLEYQSTQPAHLWFSKLW